MHKQRGMKRLLGPWLGAPVWGHTLLMTRAWDRPAVLGEPRGTACEGGGHWSVLGGGPAASRPPQWPGWDCGLDFPLKKNGQGVPHQPSLKMTVGCCFKRRPEREWGGPTLQPESSSAGRATPRSLKAAVFITNEPSKWSNELAERPPGRLSGAASPGCASSPSLALISSDSHLPPPSQPAAGVSEGKDQAAGRGVGCFRPGGPQATCGRAATPPTPTSSAAPPAP